MNPVLSALIAVGLLTRLGVADYLDPTPEQYCFTGCQEALVALNVAFDGYPSLADGYFLQECTNELFVQSVYLCGRLYCSESEVTSGSRYTDAQCAGLSYYNETTRAMVNALSDAEMTDIPRLSYDDMDIATKIVNTTLIPDAYLASLGERTTAVYYDGRTVHLWYSYAMFLFWAGICFLGVTNNILVSLRSHQIPSSPKPPTGIVQSALRKIRARFILPATFEKRCGKPVWQCTIPPRAETVIIAAFIAINIVLCAVSYEIFDDNLYWPDHRLQIWRYFSDRTGYLSYTNMAICWLFGIRNNLLIWMTGWNFATFNRFHRWVARIATLQAILHSIGYSVYSVIEDDWSGYYLNFVEQYWYTGVVATCTMSLMLGFSILYLRVKFYDLFLLLHIGLALVTLVCLFYHTAIFLGTFDGWLWACVAFWVFDRACRYARVFYFTVLRRGFSSATELDDEAGLIRIDVTKACSKGKGTSSGYFFLYSPLTWWESHPFTLVHWMEENGASQPLVEELSGPKSLTTVTSMSPSGSVIDKYSLLIRPYAGYTSRLRRSLRKQTGPTQKRFLLEGPYGHSPNLNRFTDVYFLIGGSGVSIAITSIYDILKYNANARINLIWSSRTPGLIDTVLERELAVALRSNNFAVHAYITGSKEALRAAASCRSIQFQRPNIPEIIHSASEEQTGALAVVVCGPASLTDDARAAFCTELSSHKRDMELFVESFNW